MSDCLKISLEDGSCLTVINEQAYHMSPHMHEALQILVPLEEAHYEISWLLEDKSSESKTLGPGDICIIPPFLEHEVRWFHKSHMINYYLTTEFLSKALEEDFDPQERLLQPQIGIKDSFLLQLSKVIETTVKQACSPKKRMLASSFTVAANYVYSTYVLELEPVHFSNSLEQIPCEKIRIAAQYMSTILDRALSVTEIADHVQMSPYHFVRTFKEMMGITPAKLHMLYRLEEGKRLLQIPTKSLVEIAYDIGFSSQSHFSKNFQQNFGQTPNQYRKNL